MAVGGRGLVVVVRGARGAHQGGGMRLPAACDETARRRVVEEVLLLAHKTEITHVGLHGRSTAGQTPHIAKSMCYDLRLVQKGAGWALWGRNLRVLRGSDAPKDLLMCTAVF